MEPEEIELQKPTTGSSLDAMKKLDSEAKQENCGKEELSEVGYTNEEECVSEDYVCLFDCKVTDEMSDRISFNGELAEVPNSSSVVEEVADKHSDSIGMVRKSRQTELREMMSELELQTIVYDAPSLEGKFKDDFEEATEEREGEENDYMEGQLLLSNEEFPIPTPESVTEDENELSSEEELDSIETGTIVTVKLRTDTDETMTSAFKVHSTIMEVKERLAKIFKVTVKDIRLEYEGEECDDLLPLSGLGAEPLGTLELGIRSTDPERVLAPGTFSRYIPVVDVITVRVARDDGCFKYVVVEIENQSFVKEWLGGYRNRNTKVEYHHAVAQTLPRKRPPGSLPQFSSETQTPKFPLKEIAIDTTVTKATQMWRTDHYIPNIDDKILATNPERFERKNAPLPLLVLASLVTKIQRCYRSYVNRKKINLMKAERKRCYEEQLEAKRIRENTLKNSNRNMIVGTTFPIKRGDFYMLYLMVGKWWRSEINRVMKTKDNECRKAALLEVLEKEIELLSLIEQQRIVAKKEILLKQEMTFLEITARPIIFRNNRGVMSSIDTLETQQAREYQEIMSSFVNTEVTTEQRIDTLCTLKHLIKSYGLVEYTQELVKLLERECNLLLLGMKGEQVKELRERTLQLLTFYLHNNVINPSAKNFKKSNMPKTDSSLYRCIHCNKLKPACDYNVHVKMTAFNECHSCEWIRNIGHQRIDLTPFATLLKQVRQSEMENCCYSSNCFVLQVVGMQYLVRTIWQSKSILSDASDMNKLRMVRFRREEDWSPWNCILLTLEESVAHLSIDDVYGFYDAKFIERIKWKHMRARNHFLPLLLNDKHMRETRLWFNVQDSGKFLHPSHINTFAQQADFEYIA